MALAPVVVTYELLQKALAVIQALPAGQPWPQDDWFSLTENVDLNLFTGPLSWAFGSRHATLYPVEFGRTKTTGGGTRIDKELNLNPSGKRK